MKHCHPYLKAAVSNRGPHVAQSKVLCDPV